MKMINLIAIAAGLITCVSCFAQGGGSVNGPDLKGNMIPIYSDGEIPTEKLNSALDTCYKRMGEQVLGTIFGRGVKLGKSYSAMSMDSAKPDNSSAPISKNERTVNYWYGTGKDESPSIEIQKDDLIRIRPQTSDQYSYEFSINFSHPTGYNTNEWMPSSQPNLSFAFGFSNNSHSDTRYIFLKSYDFPFISYELKDKSMYGELGEVIDKKMFVSNIHFNYKPNTTQTIFTLKAERELDKVDVDTPMKIDSLDLIQCIKSNLAQ